MKTEEKSSKFYKISKMKDGNVIGRASLFLIYNEMHEEPYGLLEDVFVEENFRGQGIGTELVKSIIKKAKDLGCYKLLATSRFKREKVHDLYVELGFDKWGYEFRMNLE